MFIVPNSLNIQTSLEPKEDRALLQGIKHLVGNQALAGKLLGPNTARN
jgi:hypothetical protein